MARWKNLQAGFATSKLHLSAPKEKAPPRKVRGRGGEGRTRLPQSPDQSICLCLWLNSNKGQGLEVLIFSNPKIKQSSHCCGAPSRRRVGATPINGRIPSGAFCVGSG